VAALYRGIAFPFQQGDTSFPEAATDNDLIRQSLLQIVLTQKGERVMRPDFGTNVFSYVFENNNDVLEEMIRVDVSQAVARYEPRVLVRAIDVTREDTTINITVRYVIVATRQEDSVQIPVPGGTT